MRLIDADKFADEFYHMPELVYTDAIARCIEMQPAVDASPIVWCKDCKHRCTDNFEPPKDKDGDADYSCPCICRDSYYTWIPDDDFFCGNGEKKDDEQNA